MKWYFHSYFSILSPFPCTLVVSGIYKFIINMYMEALSNHSFKFFINL